MSINAPNLWSQLIAGPDYVPHWKEGISNEDYHADKTHVSSTPLKVALKSALSFHSYFWDSVAHQPTAAMLFGTLVHQVVLEGPHFLKNYVVMPEFGDCRNKANKAAKEHWLLDYEGCTIVTQKEFDDIRGMLDSVMNHHDAFNLLKNGATEVSGYYADPVTRIRCRIRPDFFSTDLMTLVDLKTTIDCTRDAFSRTCFNYKYHMQMAMYCEGVKEITGRHVEYPAFIALEKEPPYECAVYLADKPFMDAGRQAYFRSLEVVRRAIDTGDWPGCEPQLTQIYLPHWAL